MYRFDKTKSPQRRATSPAPYIPHQLDTPDKYALRLKVEYEAACTRLNHLVREHPASHWLDGPLPPMPQPPGPEYPDLRPRLLETNLPAPAPAHQPTPSPSSTGQLSFGFDFGSEGVL